MSRGLLICYYWRMKILYVITELHRGGAEKNLFYLACALKDKHDIRVACLYGDGVVADDLKAEGITVDCIDFDHILSLNRLKGLVKLMRQFQPDLVHTFLFHANIAGRYAARKADIPATVISSVRVAERGRRWHLLLDRLTSGMIDAEVCVSESVREFTEKKAGIDPAKLHTITNAIDAAAYTASPLPEGKRIITYIGRLHKQKGVDVLLHAATGILAEIPNVFIRIVGDGPEKSHLEHLSRYQRIVENKTEFIDFSDDVPGILAESTLLVLPSRWEGMPNIIMEAMACARPVVATNVDGNAELVRDGKTGLLVPPEEPRALCDAIVRLLRNRDLAEEMGRAGRARIEEHFSIEKMVTAYGELYGKCAESTQ